MPQRMMTLAEELAGHCLAAVHSLQPWGEGRTERRREKKERERGKRRKRETTGKEKPPSFMETGPR